MEAIFVDVAHWLEGVGGWAYVIAPLVTAGVAILPIPAEAPALANGMLFGIVRGSVVTWVGAMLGAQASFELARAFGRPAAARLLKPSALERVDAVVEQAGWAGLLVARFVPVVAFTAVNWGAGLTSISRWTFVWTTAVGIAPAAVLFTASGSGLAALLVSRSYWAALGGTAVLIVLVIVWLCFRGGRDRPPHDAPAGSDGDGPDR